jgi:hypothetical protein
VKDHAVPELRKPFQGLPGFMDDVVIQDEVNFLSSPVGAGDPFQKRQEQPGVLPLGFGVNDTSCSGIESSGQVSLLVFTRSQNDRLPPLPHIGEADSGIEIHVRFVNVKDFFPAGTASNKTTDRIQDAAAPPHGDS